MSKKSVVPVLTALSLCAGLSASVLAEVKVPDRLQAADKVVYCGAMDSPPLA